MNLFDSKTTRKISYAAAVKKANSKTNLQIRRTNSNLRRAGEETNIQDKTQRSIIQQLDIRNNENRFYNRNALATTKTNIRMR